MSNKRLLGIVSIVTIFFFAWFSITADFAFGKKNHLTYRFEKGTGKDIGQEDKLVAMTVNLEEKEKPGYRTSIIQKEAKKKRRKWLWYVGGSVVLGVVLYFLLRGGDQKEPPIPEFEWVEIPAGNFLMGSKQGEADEQPEHPVYLDRYELSKYEVTFDQYELFCQDTGRMSPADIVTDGRKYTWGRGRRPVINVSWEEARAFCRWLSRKTGENIDLPTEAQWERAAKGLEQRQYPWGNDSPGCNRGNYEDCSPATTVDVGLFADGRTPDGIFDMAGNVWEWCKDCYLSTYYSISPDRNPQGPENTPTRVLRGGSYSSDSWDIRTTKRYRRAPETIEWYIGFRICRNY